MNRRLKILLPILVLIITGGVIVLLVIQPFKTFPGTFKVGLENDILMKKWGFKKITNYRVPGTSWLKVNGDTSIYLCRRKEKIFKEICIRNMDSLELVNFRQKVNGQPAAFDFKFQTSFSENSYAYYSLEDQDILIFADK